MTNNHLSVFVILLLWLPMTTSFAFSAPASCRQSLCQTHKSPCYQSKSLSAVASFSDYAPTDSNFEQRMRELIQKQRSNELQRKTQRRSRLDDKPSNVSTVRTVDHYRDMFAREKGKIVVVRFFATWCKACKAMAPRFYKLARSHPNVSFVEVPVSDKNADLHQGLSVPSVPFGHIYHPTAGLVEEMRISKRHFPKFQSIFESYVKGSCEVLDGECANPYQEQEKDGVLS